ncbi:MAG: acyl-CoA reductase [Ilumatobacteraceae bacterium]
MYSWLLSALCGNANVIRLSPRSIDNSTGLIDLVREALADHPTMAATTALVTYGHDHEVTQILSTADVRVIWGGDDAVASVRAVPSAPYTRDLAFPDRFSLSALSARAVEDASDAQVSELAHALFNDAYWFDQLGCASPRLIVWVGDGRTTGSASSRLATALRVHLQARGHPMPPTSAVMAKFVHVADAAARGLVSHVARRANPLPTATGPRLVAFARHAPGGGLFYETRVDDITDLATHVERKDQTLGIYGIEDDAVRRLVESLGSRGIDRILPIGQALQFDRFWDGVDLLTEFTRAVSLPATFRG